MATPNSSSLDPSTSNCPICSEPFDPATHRAATIRGCDHTFCMPCLVEWFNSQNPNSNRCPMCRIDILTGQAQSPLPDPDASNNNNNDADNDDDDDMDDQIPITFRQISDMSPNWRTFLTQLGTLSHQRLLPLYRAQNHHLNPIMRDAIQLTLLELFSQPAFSADLILQLLKADLVSLRAGNPFTNPTHISLLTQLTELLIQVSIIVPAIPLPLATLCADIINWSFDPLAQPDDTFTVDWAALNAIARSMHRDGGAVRETCLSAGLLTLLTGLTLSTMSTPPRMDVLRVAREMGGAWAGQPVRELVGATRMVGLMLLGSARESAETRELLEAVRNPGSGCEVTHAVFGVWRAIVVQLGHLRGMGDEGDGQNGGGGGGDGEDGDGGDGSRGGSPGLRGHLLVGVDGEGFLTLDHMQ